MRNAQCEYAKCPDVQMSRCCFSNLRDVSGGCLRFQGSKSYLTSNCQTIESSLRDQLDLRLGSWRGNSVTVCTCIYFIGCMCVMYLFKFKL